MGIASYLDEFNVFLITDFWRCIVDAAWGEFVFRVGDHIRIVEICKDAQ